ncbi:hypothetical protein [Rubellicoccus peritrichatus]|uniref:Uncharacterized protein n=1 Tax=Rubellicoccus peritrichatus TaxID=3080537 RepID=A0AAQ3QXM9_9BACT|nr:hypothetical protein [Puniceicoccus sp. CR14]WOO43020.1 hypothetical protein RZN69_07935 [Puniceicoccus sp. CR14]
MTNSILFILILTASIGFLFYAHKRKWFFLSQVDYERYKANKGFSDDWANFKDKQ